MGCNRRSRPSEITFNEMFVMMPALAYCVWSGELFIDDAKEGVEVIKEKLDLMIKQMETEQL